MSKRAKKPTTINIGTHHETGRSVRLDLDQLIRSRMLLQANSGGGKSWAIRRLLERTHGKVQPIVIDPEGEFYTLREKFDYVLCGKGGDCPAEVRSAALLARRLLELGCSAVIDIYELKPRERVKFVDLFINALVDAPKSLWHPALIIIDEAHTFAPQKGDAESFDAIASLMSKGRKRGFCGVLATQRMSKLHKDVAAEANNMIIGRARQDVDRKRAGEELGFAGKNESRVLQSLDPGDFFAFGPAFDHDGVELITIGKVKTPHPEAGSSAIPPAPPKKKIKALLAELTDIPAEALKEAATVDELKATIRQLRADAPQKGKTVYLQKELDQHREEGRKDGVDAGFKSARADFDVQLSEIRKCVDQHLTPLTKAIDCIESTQRLLTAIDVVDETAQEGLKKSMARAKKTIPLMANRRDYKPNSVVLVNTELDGPMKKIIDAIAWFESTGIESPYSKVPIAAVAKYSSRSGSFNNALGRLRSAKLIEYPSPGCLALTEDGRTLADCPMAPLTRDELHQRFRENIDGPMWKILEPLIESHPTSMTRSLVANDAGYSATSGSFNNALGRLRTMGLIEYPEIGWVVACKVLFP